ncbi:S41 family peptidase [Ellagibacter isourolithinifaciens]|uniref:S41 family peptidase n=1 Tax=Ellagibacter isourolithinifaciens TaxID=2137581 RepID=UPI003A8F8EF0
MAKHGDTKQRAAMAEREHRRNKRILRLLCFVVAIAVAFVAGFALRSQDQFLVSLGFSIPGVQKAGTQSADVKKSPYDSISARLSEVEDVLAKSDLNGYDLDEATKEVFKGFSSACDDKYFEYLDPSRYASFVKDSSDGAYNGVGVLFSDYNGRALVSDVFSGSAAEAAGVQQGDVLIGIDGDTSHDWSVTEAISGLSRNAGETVVVTWMRPSSVGAETGMSYTTALTCSSYKEQNVTYSLDGTVGYIRVRQITQDTADNVSAALADLIDQGATSFVVDLRDNPGGYLTQAVDVANLFIKTGVIVEVQTSTGTSPKSASGKTVTDLPLVVLTNGYTSGAAEVLAAALQDNQRATIVGETTIGKGSVQVVHELSFGGAIRYTAGYYKSPLGHDIDGVGVIPDIAISSSEGGTDPQLVLAVETAQNKEKA